MNKYEAALLAFLYTIHRLGIDERGFIEEGEFTAFVLKWALK